MSIGHRWVPGEETGMRLGPPTWRDHVLAQAMLQEQRQREYFERLRKRGMQPAWTGICPPIGAGQREVPP